MVITTDEVGYFARAVLADRMDDDETTASYDIPEECSTPEEAIKEIKKEKYRNLRVIYTAEEPADIFVVLKGKQFRELGKPSKLIRKVTLENAGDKSAEE